MLSHKSVVLFCCSLLWLTKGKAAFVTFTLEPKDAIVEFETSHMLQCAAQSDTPISYVWTLNGVEVGTGQDYTITSVDDATEGDYACLVQTSSGVVSSRTARIQTAKIFNVAIPNTQHLNVTEGDPLVLDCSNFNFVSSSLPTVIWQSRTSFITNINFQPDAGVIPGLNDFKLYFTAINSDQAGRYSCTITVVGRPPVTRHFNVTVVPGTPTEHTTLLSLPHDITVADGAAMVHSQCIPPGNPTPPVMWYKENNPQNSAMFPPPLGVTQVIQYSSISKEDEGSYGCTWNGLNYTATISVIEAPVVSISSENVTLLYGATLQLECASPAMEVPLEWKWLANGTEINNDNRTAVSGAVLTITSMVFADTGYYQCIARNPAGSAVGTSYVDITILEPSFVDGGELVDTIAFIGEMLELTCEAEGAPPPSYRWLSNNTEIATPNERFLFPLPGHLIIEEVSNGDTGDYTCIAETVLPDTGSTFSTSVQSTAQVVVILPTVFTDISGPHVYRQTNSASNTIELKCATTSENNSRVEYRWYKNGEPFDINIPGGRLQRQSSASGSFQFLQWSMSDSGVYKCEVSTSIDTLPAAESRVTSTSVNLTITDIPAPPTINEVVTLNDSAISILWLYEGDLEAILSYAIYIQREGSGEEFEKSIQIVNRNIINSTISGLFPYTLYRVRIEAMDNNLHTASQVSGFIRTSESVPTAVPGNVASEEVNSTHLQIFWQHPPLRLADGRGRNGIITSYTIRYRLESEVGYMRGVTQSNATSVILKGSSIYVQIAANTSVGMGPFSPESLQDGSGPTPPEEPFWNSVWFIVVIAIVGVMLIVAVIVCLSVIFCCLRKRWRSKTFEVHFHGGNQPSFDVHQYEMDKQSRMRSVHYGQSMMPTNQPNTVEHPLHDCNTQMYPMNGYTVEEKQISEGGPAYIAPPPFYAFEASQNVDQVQPEPINWEYPVHQAPPHMYGRHRAQSLEWDPRYSEEEWIEPDSSRSLIPRRHSRSVEWLEPMAYPTATPQSVDIVNVGDDSGSSVNKPPISTDDDQSDLQDSGSAVQSGCSTFV